MFLFFSTYFIFTPCLTASTLIIPVLDLDVLFPFSLCLSRDLASDRHSSFDATVSESGAFEALISVLADLKLSWMIENGADVIGIQNVSANSALRPWFVPFRVWLSRLESSNANTAKSMRTLLLFRSFYGPPFLIPYPHNTLQLHRLVPLIHI
jgi:hypothetical protein